MWYFPFLLEIQNASKSFNKSFKYHSETRELKCVCYLKLIVIFFKQFGMEQGFLNFFKDKSLNIALDLLIFLKKCAKLLDDRN